MEIIHTIQMDFTRPEPIRPRIDAVQGDTCTRVAELVLYADGSPWVMPEGMTVRIRYHKPDDTGGSYDTLPDGTRAWWAEGNLLRLILAPQMLTVPGRVEAQGELSVEQEVLGTFSFYVVVHEDPAFEMPAPEDYVNWVGWMESELDRHLSESMERGDFIPALSVGSVTMLPAGEKATAVFTGEKQAPVLSLGIPDGVMQCWESADYPGCYFRRTDAVTEWDNPPMLTGREYRTTERFLGKPVYIYTFEMTNLHGFDGAQADLDEHIIGIDHIFSCGGILSDGRVLPYETGVKQITLGVDENYVWVVSHSGPFEDLSATVWVKYTKSADKALIDVDGEGDSLIINTVLAVRTEGDAIIIGGGEDAV